MSTDENAVIENALLATRAQLSVLGMFKPLELLNVADATQMAVLQRLAADCVEVVVGDDTLWQLSTDARTQSLQLLKDSNTLPQQAEAARPSHSDRLGHFLQRILLGHDIAMEDLGVSDLGHLRTALQLAGPIVDRRNETKRIDTQIARHDAEAAVKILLPKSLIGRTRELTRLRTFVFKNTGLADDFILWVTGVGGVGKSALLANFVRELRGEKWSGVPVLTVDFDRPSFYQGRLSSIFMEMSRQLELYRPPLANALSDFRDAVRRNEASSDNSRFHDRATSGIALLSEWKECLGDHLPISDEVVVVFDTLEEVASSSNLSLKELAGWLHRLKAAGMPKLRPIFSGRAFYPEFVRGLPKGSQLELGDLAPPAALELLQTMLGSSNVFVPASLASLVEMLGGNPLMLKILAVHLREGGQKAADEILGDRSGFDRRFAQTFLYKRLLGRIRSDDPDVVKVAHPGLILRRVTPQLIQQVLAIPCGLGDVTDARAKVLFSKLSQQVWLVQVAGADVVLHRKDLRRLMLQAMTSDDTRKAAAVHGSAMSYYADYLDPGMTKEQQRVEYFYHRMFTPDAALPPPEVIPSFVRALGEDIETLPDTWRASLKLGANQKLLAAEAVVLRRPESVKYADDVEKRTVLEKGFASFDSGPTNPSDPLADDPRKLLSRAQNAFESGVLQPAIACAELAVELFGISSNSSSESDSRDFTESAVWRAAMLTLRQSKRFTSALDLMIASLRPSRLEEPLNYFSKNSVTLGGACLMLYRLHGANPTTALGNGFERLRRVDNLSSLRFCQLGGRMPIQGFEVQLRLLSDLADELRSSDGLNNSAMSLDREATHELKDRPRTADKLKHSLHDLNRMRPSNGCLIVHDLGSLQPNHHTKLRGLTPEIYPLVRAAARKCPIKLLVEFSSTMSGKPYWPVELSGKELADHLSDDRETWTSTFIEVTDRMGQLQSLVNLLIERGRGTRPLLQVVRDYDSRLREFFNPR